MSLQKAFQIGVVVTMLAGGSTGGSQTRAEAQAPPAAKAHPAAPAPPAARAPFRPGETLIYSISWRLFTAGEARMHVDHAPNAADSWQASLTAYSTGFVSKLYRVDDRMTSTFDSGRMCSQSLVKVLNEGRRHREIHIDFERDRRLAVMRESEPGSANVLKQAENIAPECTYDVVSALYYVRTLPLEVGRTYQVFVNDGARTLPITVEVQAKEDVKTDAGTFHTVRVEPLVTGGSLFRRSGRMQLWFTDDSQRLLVQLKAKLFVGTISAVLQRAEYTPGS